VRRLVPAVLVAALALCAAAQASTADPSAWTSYGYDNQLGNAVATGTLTLRAVPKLRLDWSRQLDGAVYASPLAANVGGRQLLFAASTSGAGCGLRTTVSTSSSRRTATPARRAARCRKAA
jgi:hypothetical protein